MDACHAASSFVGCSGCCLRRQPRSCSARCRTACRQTPPRTLRSATREQPRHNAWAPAPIRRALPPRPTARAFVDLRALERFCHADPPCESRCQASPPELRPPGAECYYDADCAGPFARCLQRMCRRALLTHQACDANDANDLCVTGQRICFRGRCLGLSTGSPCSAHVEGADIECNHGWYCFLGVCTPQLPAGHSCTGLHPDECLHGYGCNLAVERPRCIREYSLTAGETSSTGKLCMTNHVNPVRKECAQLPELELEYGRPLVSGRDCLQDGECPRTDTSIGQCLCKQWWEGQGQPGFCELSVAQPWRPAFRRFWEAATTYCHHNWTPERCAAELGLEGVLAQVQLDQAQLSADPTEIQSCAADLLTIFAPDAARLRGLPILSLGIALSRAFAS
ncbi:unnamed protein product [Effrenium voratum]|nr:unnamed protein product [Effrenium voratum]